MSTKLEPHVRERIARKRLENILSKHGVANARTLEQKISDAGPFGQRINPHVLGRVRSELIEAGKIISFQRHGAHWFHLASTSQEVVQHRLNAQTPTWEEMSRGAFKKRMGQTLEIATWRALAEAKRESLGFFRDLADHDDSTMYSKEEPPSYFMGRSLAGGKRLDFMARDDNACWLGIECKNIREWIYPDRPEVKEFLLKCLTLDLVPVLIARRVHYVTFRLLQPCGVLIHQTYNQLFPAADQELADRARHKEILGYHDIRTGNMPDARLTKFISHNLQLIAYDARQRLKEYGDLLLPFADGSMPYLEFAARVRRRQNGENEDFDPRGDGDDLDYD